MQFDYGSRFASYEPNAIKIWARTSTATSGLTINDLKITTPGVAGETVFPGTSIAVSQASGTVFQEIIIAGIDFQSVSGGTVTLEGNVTMQFGADPALRGSALQFHVIATHIPWVDLDVDSNNDGTIDLTNGRRGTDDRIEQSAPGKIIPVGGARAEMLVTLPAGRNATLELKADAADTLKFYTQREGGEPLAFHTFGPNDDPAFDMSLVPGRQRVNATDSWTLWVEATGPSTTAGDLVFTLTGDSNGPPAWDVARAKLNAAPNMNDQTRNVFVGEPDEALVGPRLNATDPDGDTLTWSIVAGSAPADLPFEIDARTGQISVEISAGGLRVLNTEYQQSDIAKTGEYTFDVKVDDGKGNAATAAVTVTLNQVKEMNGVTIHMRGKSLKSTTAVAGYILQGGRDGVGGLVGGLVKEAAEELLTNAKGGDVTLFTTGPDEGLWPALWPHSANVTPQVNSVISLEFDYDGGLTAARNAAELPEVTRFVTDADALFFQGGDQAQYLAVWRDTPLQQAVQAKKGLCHDRRNERRHAHHVEQYYG